MLSDHSKRAGWALLSAGILAAAAMMISVAVLRMCLVAFAAFSVLTGILLLRGGPRAALWGRSLVVFLLAAGLTALIAAPLYQPLDLTVTEMRLDPGGFAGFAGMAVPVLLLLLWIALELGRPAVRDAIASARIRRWDMRVPAQAGCGIVVLAGLLLWLMLHGQSADLATSLALQQLGPDYRYHLSWLRNSNSSHGRSVIGVVTAWKQDEVKTVLLRWEVP